MAMLMRHLLLHGPATELLELDVQQAPALLQETSPAVWHKCHDFTGGEASRLRFAVCLPLYVARLSFSSALGLTVCWPPTSTIMPQPIRFCRCMHVCNSIAHQHLGSRMICNVHLQDTQGAVSFQHSDEPTARSGAT